LWKLEACRHQNQKPGTGASQTSDATTMFSRATLSCSRRLYSTAPPNGPPVKLIAELRKLTEVSISKAREALTASNNDVRAAFKWLQDDLVASGAKKAEKLGGRTTNQGLVGVSLLSRGVGDGTGKGKGGVRAAMVELNCETDFVARNPRFDTLVADIAHTAAFIVESTDLGELLRSVPLELLKDAPLLSSTGAQPEREATVGGAIHDSIARFDEMISLGRAIAIVQDPLPRGLGLRVASYAHGAVAVPSHGRVATLAVLAFKSPKLGEIIASQAFRDDVAKLERSLARQIVGFPTTTVKSVEGTQAENVLYEQEFTMFPGSNGQKVSEVLRSWALERGLVGKDSLEDGGVEVIDFAKWTIGEAIA
jgi:elongation factor Ts